MKTFGFGGGGGSQEEEEEHLVDDGHSSQEGKGGHSFSCLDNLSLEECRLEEDDSFRFVPLR